MKKLSVVFAVLFGFTLLTSAFTSCTSEIDLKLNKDGSVNVSFSGAAGVAFNKLILAAIGEEEGEIAFNTNQISYELAKNGFSNVKAVSKTGTDLSITMTDEKKTSSLFTSGVLSIEKGKLKAALSPAQLKDFYSKSDEQIIMFLDMLLAPVFNDEEMSKEEYLDVIASFYGTEASKELGESSFKIKFTNPDGSTVSQNIPLATLLTLQEFIQIK